MDKLDKTISLESDRKTLTGIASGDAGALKALYRDYFPMVLHMVVQNSGTAEEAKDVFQEAVIVLYDRISQGKFELNSKLKTYLYAVCRRLWLKQLGGYERTFQDVTHYEETIPVEDDLAVHEEKDQQMALMELALNQLGEPCRSIIQEFYVMGRSMQEICEKFGYTNADNAKNQKYKCLQRLKKIYFTANNNENE